MSCYHCPPCQSSQVPSAKKTKTASSSSSSLTMVRSGFCICFVLTLATSYNSLSVPSSFQSIDEQHTKHNDEGMLVQLGCPNNIQFGDEIGSLLDNHKVNVGNTLDSTLEESVKNTTGGFGDGNSTTRDDPRLFIHVGPVKTGSSSIECNLMVNPFLKESSYEYMGKKDNFCSDSTHRRTKPRFFNVPNLVFQYILRGWLGQTSTNEDFNEYVANFKTTFRDRFDKGIHTILSAEEFCGLLELAETDPKKNDTRLQHFADLLNDIPQSITFQVVYRHNYDWAVSFYQFEELYQKSEEAHAHKKGAKSSMTDAAMDSILDRKALFLQKSQPECSSHKIWKFLRERLIPLLHRGSVEVLDYHNPEEPDIARNYVCNLPGAHVACNKTRENLHLKRSNPTPVDHLHADRIATAAWENGMYRNASALKNKRPQVRKMVIDHVRNNLNSSFMELPLECLSKHELVRSLDLSLSIGRAMLGNNLDAGAMTCKFLRDESKKKFCSVNVTALLTEPSWSNFFRDLDY